jgi:glycerol-3-phosphate dehydrogenase subunit B
MSFDVVIIGAGLAGLCAGLRAAEAGARVQVLAKGAGSLHLGGSTIDVLGYAPDLVASPADALPGFVASNPEHPYARLGPERVGAAIEWFKNAVDDIEFAGGLGENYLLPTAVGAVKPTALVPTSLAAGDVKGRRRFLLVSFAALKDFYPSYLAGNLNASDSASARSLTLDTRLPGPLGSEADVNGLGFARSFEDTRWRESVMRDLEEHLDGVDAVGFPAVLGRDDARGVWRELQEGLGRPVFEIPTLPPSVPGIRLYRSLVRGIKQRGGAIVVGSAVVEHEAAKGKVRAVFAEAAARPTRHEGSYFVLATGGVGAGGIEMDSSWRIRESIFDLPLRGAPGPEGERFAPEYFADHPANQAGVATDERGRAVDDNGGVVYENLYVTGANLFGARPWREKSGNGLSVATGHAAAEDILGNGE